MRCAVYGCNVNNKGKNFSKEMPFHFHSFPKDEEQCNRWVALCRRCDKFNKDTSRICSKHFAQSDYAGLNSFLENFGIPMKAQRLKPNVLPSLFLPLNDEDRSSTVSFENSQKLTKRRHCLKKSPKTDYIPICSSANNNQGYTYEVTEFANALPHQKVTDYESPNSLGAADNDIELRTPIDVKVELLETTPYQIDCCTLIDQRTLLREDSSNTRKCDATVIDHSHTASSSFEAQIRKSDWNLEDPNTDRWHSVQLEFLNHVLLVWLNRCRSGKLKFVMPDAMLRSKAKEAARILDTFIVCPTTWIREFKDKLRKEDARQPPKYNPLLFDQSKDIVDIIEEEWTRFRCKDDDSLSQGSQFRVKEETNPDIRSYEETLAIPLGERSNAVESSIESYQEAIDCLMMVKRYAFSVRNLSAVVIITELEDILKLECL